VYGTSVTVLQSAQLYFADIRRACVCVCDRCGDIFEAAFVARMSSFARQAGLSEQVQSLLAAIHDEAKLGCVEATKSSCADHAVQQLPDDGTEDAPATKRSRRSSSLDDSIKSSPVNTESESFGDRMQDTCVAKCSSTFQTKDAEVLQPVTNLYSNGPMFYYCPYRRRLKNVNIPK